MSQFAPTQHTVPFQLPHFWIHSIVFFGLCVAEFLQIRHLRERHIETGKGVIEANIWFSSGQCKRRTAGHDELIRDSEFRDARSYEKTVKFVFHLLLPLVWLSITIDLPVHLCLDTDEWELKNTRLETTSSHSHTSRRPELYSSRVQSKIQILSSTGLTEWWLGIRCIWGGRIIIRSIVIIWILLGKSSVKMYYLHPENRKPRPEAIASGHACVLAKSKNKYIYQQYERIC